ncbi:MAG: hypothetical protein EPN43_06965 [Jatrophihabitans sp.]|nr:MAG: hypothetical protein EPN43_06965 [Jatrophihabitans sp.]
MPVPFADLQPEGPPSPLVRLSRQPRLPPEARELLRRIDTEATVALQYLASVPGSGALATVRIEAARDRDAPDVVRAFLDLPPSEADAVLEAGRTAQDVLVADLQTLLAAIREEMGTAAQAVALDARIQHRFIVDKYGASGLDRPDGGA